MMYTIDELAYETANYHLEGMQCSESVIETAALLLELLFTQNSEASQCIKAVDLLALKTKDLADMRSLTPSAFRGHLGALTDLGFVVEILKPSECFVSVPKGYRACRLDVQDIAGSMAAIQLEDPFDEVRNQLINEATHYLSSDEWYPYNPNEDEEEWDEDEDEEGGESW